MNRHDRRAAKHIIGPEVTKGINLFLNLKDECLHCKLKFDKMNKEMATTWIVEVRAEDSIVNLYCPECHEKVKKVRKLLDDQKEKL